MKIVNRRNSLSNHTQLVRGVSGNHCVRSQQCQIFGYGLGDQCAVKRILMNRRQRKYRSDVLSPKEKRRQSERVEGEVTTMTSQYVTTLRKAGPRSMASFTGSERSSGIPMARNAMLVSSR